MVVYREKFIFHLRESENYLVIILYISLKIIDRLYFVKYKRVFFYGKGTEF